MELKGKTAEEMADLIAERRAVAERRAIESLKSKCVDAVSKMVVDLEYETIVELTDNDLLALIPVTEQLRNLNYKFRFIEVQDTNGEIVGQKLAISIMHVK